MARIVISSRGTLGDYVPFVALGKQLRARGHDVVLALNAAVAHIVKQAGLELFPCGNPFGEREARRLADGWDFWKPLPEKVFRARQHLVDFSDDYRDLTAACRGADVLITSCFQEAGPLVHEATGIPWVSVAPTPMIFCQEGDAPRQAGPAPGWDGFYLYQNAIRVKLGFRKLAYAEWETSCLSEQLALVASSPHFSRPSRARYPGLRLTGFWFDDETVRAFRPAAELEAFVSERGRPLVLTYSGLPVVEPERVLAVHAEAAARCGRRLLVQRGWAGFTEAMLPAKLRSSVFFWPDFIPHGWLFKRAAAVIHHAGLGTTASCLRAGCPMIVEPYGNDQFRVAARIRGLGAGVALHPHRVTAEELADVLRERVLTGVCRARVRRVAARLRGEDGLARACALIEKRFRLRARPPRRRTNRVAACIS